MVIKCGFREMPTISDGRVGELKFFTEITLTKKRETPEVGFRYGENSGYLCGRGRSLHAEINGELVLNEITLLYPDKTETVGLCVFDEGGGGEELAKLAAEELAAAGKGFSPTRFEVKISYLPDSGRLYRYVEFLNGKDNYSILLPVS